VHRRLRPRHPRTMDSSSLGARRRLGHDETNTTQQGRCPAHDDAMTSLAVTFRHASIALLSNKAAIDRRLRPRCCHLWSYFKPFLSLYTQTLCAKTDAVNRLLSISNVVLVRFVCFAVFLLRLLFVVCCIYSFIFCSVQDGEIKLYVIFNELTSA